MNIIEVTGLTKAYGENRVLKELNFQAQAGEVVGVIGKNGVGKSTFLEILMTIKGYDSRPNFTTMLGVFLMFYAIFWTAFYLYFRNQARKLNEELEGI